MAIQLPRASASSVGRGRGGRKARLPDAGDVPIQEVARDPGLRVPEMGAVARGISDVGVGLENLATGIQDRDNRLAAADARLNARRESVERMRSSREFHGFGNQLFTEFESSRDFSKQEDIEEFGAVINSRAEEIIANHQGSEDSKLRLRERLSPILEAISDKAGVASVKAQDALVDREFDEITNDLTARVRQGENPRVLIEDGMAFLEAEKDALRPGQETAFVRALNARVWGAKIDDYMAKGDLSAAEELLSFPEVRSAVGQEAQTKAFNRIAAARTEGKAKILTKGEMAGMGFPPETIAAGLVVQRKSDGTTNVVFNPPKGQDEGVRQKRVDALKDQFIRTGMEEQEATDRAVNITDGNISFEITTDGFAREINALDGTVKEVPLGQDSPVAQQPQQETLYEIAKRGNIAGIVPATTELFGRTVGQVPGVPIAEQVSEDRQKVQIAGNDMIRALSINPRFPVGEINRLREEIKIAPALFDSQRALLARMRGINDSLAIRLENEQRAASDPNLPQETRAASAQAAKDIGNFLTRLGVPETDDGLPPEGLPEFSTRTGTKPTGEEVWTDPTGKQWVVE